jgi:hypothetical protein
MTANEKEPTLDEIIAFLLGEGELNGRWFGEGPPPAYRGMLWWRTELRAAWNRRAAPASRVDDRRLGELINFAQDELNCAEDWNQEQRANIVAALQRLRTLEADARRLPVREFKGTDDPDTNGWTYPVEFLDAVKSAMPADDFAPSLEGIELALIGYERVIGRGLELPSISAEAAPKCETCDEGMVRCTKPGCPCGGDGCDPCPDCEKGGGK